MYRYNIHIYVSRAQEAAEDAGEQHILEAKLEEAFLHLRASKGTPIEYPTVPYSTLQYPAVRYTTLHYPTVPYSTLQYPKVLYTTLQYLYSTHRVPYSTTTVLYSTL